MNKKMESRRMAPQNNAQSNVAQSLNYNANQSQNMRIDPQVKGQRPSGSPTQSLSNIQKINARLRARNPVIMSMTTSPQMLLPLSQRSLSPSSYQQLGTLQNQQQQPEGVRQIQLNPTQRVMSPKNVNQSYNQTNIKHLQQAQTQRDTIQMHGSHPSNLNSGQQRMIHKSLNRDGNTAKKQDTSQSMSLEQRNQNGKPASSGLEGRTGHHSINMGSHIMSARQQQENMMNSQSLDNQRSLGSGGPQGIKLSKKFSGNRKRNARDKSYDLYNQKLQLPPMLKPHEAGSGVAGNMTHRAGGKNERTYSLPNAGGQVHQSMPMSPNMAINTLNTPKGQGPVSQSGANNVPNRSSINEALKNQMQNQQNNQNRFNNFNSIQMNQSSANTIQPSHKKSASTGGAQNMGSVKGFFSARGPGIRPIEKPGAAGEQQPKSSHGTLSQTRQQQAQNQQNSSFNGVFSPRRQIMSHNEQMKIKYSQNGQRIQRKASQNNAGGNQQQLATISQSQNQPKFSTNQKQVQNQAQMNQRNTLSPRNAYHQREQQKKSQNQFNKNQTLQPTQPTPPLNQSLNENSRTHTAPTQPPVQSPLPAPTQPPQSAVDANSSKSTQDQSNEDDSDEQKTLNREPTPSSNLSQDQNIQFVEVQTLLFGENPPVLNPKTILLKNHEPTKASQKKCGLIKSYAANTNQGIIREYNEDRVSIILNILKPKSKAHLTVEWPQICFFGVFDGHGGAACADYLRDNLHNFVVQNEHFPQFPQEAIVQGFKECERSFLNLVEVAQQRAQHAMPGQQVGPERSGSCATVVMIINDTAYVVNVGDSRCIMSLDAGSQIAVLSRDHKPDDEQERIRIQAAGGKIYRTQTFAKAAASPDEKDLYVQGPLRVFPGRLSVSRTFGDIEAKRAKYGGNQNVIVCEPEIKTFKLKNNFDFFMIGCDGIFERLNNKDCIEAIWDRIAEQTTNRSYDNLSPPPNPSSRVQKKHSPRQDQAFHYDEHTAAAEGVEIVLREAAASRSLDNITVLILGLKNLKKTIHKLNEGQSLQQIRIQNQNEQKGVKHTYDQDFEYLEVNEQDLNLFSDNDIHSGQESNEADTVGTIENEKKKQHSPASLSAKANGPPQGGFKSARKNE